MILTISTVNLKVLNFSAELNWGGIIYFYILKLTIIEITMIDRLLLCII